MNLNHDLVANIWYGIIGLVWAVYLAQDMFIMGASMLNVLVAGEDMRKRKQIQVSSGLHSDGIEVWLIVALGGTFAAFPMAFAVALESLYIPFFLLLVALTFRKIAIEMIFKDDSPVWQKMMSVIWVISSGLLMLILGVYLTNIFLGFEIGANGYEASIFAIFNLVGILGGVFFVCLSLVSGAMFIKLTNEGDNGDKAIKLVKIPSILVALLPLLITQGFNNKSNLFSGVLFSDHKVLWVIPSLLVITGLVVFYGTFRKKVGMTFVSTIVMMALYIAMGFIGAFPYLIPSTLDSAFGITIEMARASQYTLNVMLIAALILVPIVIGYQTFKYIYFAKKVKVNDE